MCAMIPMFRVCEMGNERATTTECLSDAQPILLGPKHEPKLVSGPPRTGRSVVCVDMSGREIEGRQRLGARLEGGAEGLPRRLLSGWDRCPDRPALFSIRTENVVSKLSCF